MSQPNGLNPDVAGVSTASLGFTDRLSVDSYGTMRVALIRTNGTTPVGIFAASSAANGFKGTFHGMATIGSDNTGGMITLKQNVTGAAGVNKTIAVVNKGPYMGSFAGSAFAGTAFTAAGSATVESDGASANATVLLFFTIARPGE